MKEIFALKICPWCRKTPTIDLNRRDHTWLVTIQCKNPLCNVKPVSRYVPVRKRAKVEYKRLFDKIALVQQYWNVDNPFRAIEGVEVDLSNLEQMVRDEKECPL